MRKIPKVDIWEKYVKPIIEIRNLFNESPLTSSEEIKI